MTARHFLELDAGTLRTPSFKLAQRNAAEVFEARGMGLSFGDAGLGKTFAHEHAVRSLDAPVHWLTFPHGTTPKTLVESLLELTTGVSHTGTRARLEPLLIEVLSERDRAITVDEAQHLNYQCVEHLRHLHDHPATRFALLFVGGNGCYELIKRYPMLSSRIARWTKFFPLEPQEVVRLLPDFHALYRGADPNLIEEIDDQYALGNLRRWTNFTHTARGLAAQAGTDSLTEPVAQAALHLIGGGFDGN